MTKAKKQAIRDLEAVASELSVYLPNGDAQRFVGRIENATKALKGESVERGSAEPEEG